MCGKLQSASFSSTTRLLVDYDIIFIVLLIIRIIHFNHFNHSCEPLFIACQGSLIFFTATTNNRLITNAPSFVLFLHHLIHHSVLQTGLTLLVPHSRTAMMQSRSFTSTGPSLWNTLPHTTRSSFLSGSPSSSLALLKTYFFFWDLAHWKRF